MAIKPLELTSISAEQMHTDNLLCGRQGVFASKIYDIPATFCLIPASNAPLMDFTLHLRIEGVDTFILLSRSVFADIKIGNTIIADVLEQLNEPVLMGCLHLIFDRALNDLKSFLQKDIELRGLKFSADIIVPALNITIEINGKTHIAQLGINNQNKAWIDKLPCESVSNVLLSTPVIATLEAGRTRLSSTRLQKIRSQDIILFDQNWYKDGSQILIRLSDRIGFLGNINNQTITLENSMEIPMGDDIDNDLDDFGDLDDLDDELDDILGDDDKTPEAQNDQTPKQAKPAPASGGSMDINAIPVQLTFDIGKQEISFGNMSQCVPGFTFQLNRPLANPVIIHANGKPLAEGELVDINGQLGTRVTRML